MYHVQNISAIWAHEKKGKTSFTLFNTVDQIGSILSLGLVQFGLSFSYGSSMLQISPPTMFLEVQDTWADTDRLRT